MGKIWRLLFFFALPPDTIYPNYFPTRGGLHRACGLEYNPMQTWIYKGCRKANTYLYVARENDFTRVPDALIQLLGDMEFVIEVDLSQKKRLALADITEVKAQLVRDGYYLQMPPGDHKPEKVC